MATQHKLDIIHKRVADIINSEAFILGYANYYDIFCSNLDISKYINIPNMYCSDISNVKIELINAYINNDVNRIKEITTFYITKSISSKENQKEYKNLEHLLKTLSVLYNYDIVSDTSFKSIEDVVKYNKEFHIEHLASDKGLKLATLGSIKIENIDYRELNILDNSIVLCYAPFEKKNILEETFNFREYFTWIDNLVSSAKVKIYILAYSLDTDKYELVTDFSDIITLNKRDNTNLKLYTIKDSCEYADYTDDW